MDVSRAFLRSEHLRRDTYAQLPEGVEKDNVAWGLLKPLYGLSTACKDWYKTIRNFLSKECGEKATSLDKSVCFWTQQDFGYEYGKGFMGKNWSNLDHGIFKINEFFETKEQKDVIGFIAIRLGDLLISGCGMFIEYATQRMKGKSEVDSYEGNEATYIGMQIMEVKNGDFEGMF